jgi:hypothetical protein
VSYRPARALGGGLCAHVWVLLPQARADLNSMQQRLYNQLLNSSVRLVHVAVQLPYRAAARAEEGEAAVQSVSSAALTMGGSVTALCPERGVAACPQHACV